MKLINTLKSAALFTTLQYTALNPIIDIHALPYKNTRQAQSTAFKDKTKRKRYKIVTQSANTANTTCHTISSKHTLCIQNHNLLINPFLIAKRFKDMIKITQESIDLPLQLRETISSDYLVIHSTQEDLESLMKKLSINAYWGYFQEDLLQSGHNSIFAYTPQDKHYKTNSSRWMYSNISHEMGHAVFSTVIQNTEIAQELLNKTGINPRVILEGFAEFIKYANTLEPKYKVKGLENSYGKQCFQFPEIYNPEHTLKTKIYSITELLNQKQKPDSDYYYYGKIFYNFIYQKHKGLYNLLLIGLLKKSDLALNIFKTRILSQELNNDFINYQHFYISTHNKLDVLLRFHIQSIYEEKN